MSIKLLNKLWIEYQATKKYNRFGQYLMSNTVIEHHLTDIGKHKLWNEINDHVSYNTALLICEN